MKAYKAFKPDWKCRGKQYEVGKEFFIKGKPIICFRGLHCCLKLSDCFTYYTFYRNVHIAEVEVIGEYVKDNSPDIFAVKDSKICCKRIKILREISHEEAFKILAEETGESIETVKDIFYCDWDGFQKG